MSQSGSFRVALAGAGMISHHHLLAWSRLPEVAVVAICDPSEQRARERCAAFKIPEAFTDFATMLERTRPDAVDIATPVATHAPLVREALRCGAHALCQKPLCPTLDEALALVGDLPRAPRLMVHENWRFRPWYRRVAQWLREERVGIVRQVAMSSLGSGLLPDREGRRPALVRQAYLANERRLIVADALIHHLDVLRFLLGPLRVTAAATARGCDVVVGETCATAMLVDERGSAVLIEGNMAARGYPPRPRDRLEILGDDGRILLEGDQLALEAQTQECLALDLDAGYQACFGAAIAHFVDCVAKQQPFETSPEDNIETLRLVEAIYELAGPSGAAKKAL